MASSFQAHEFHDTLMRVGQSLVRHKFGTLWRQGGCRYLAQTLAECDGITLGESGSTSSGTPGQDGPFDCAAKKNLPSALPTPHGPLY